MKSQGVSTLLTPSWAGSVEHVAFEAICPCTVVSSQPTAGRPARNSLA